MHITNRCDIGTIRKAFNVDVVGKLVRVLGIRDFEWPLEWRIVVVTNLILLVAFVVLLGQNPTLVSHGSIYQSLTERVSNPPKTASILRTR
jgi:low affinity Fe/Cu permease